MKKFMFEGKSIVGGEIVTGSLIQYPNHAWIKPEWSCPFSDDGSSIGEFELFEVGPDTVRAI